MHHRALGRLHQTSTLSLASPFSFTHLLHTAAGRAWARRVSSLPATPTRAPRERIRQGSSRSCGRPTRKLGSTSESARKHGYRIKISRPDSDYLHAQDRNITTSTIYTIDKAKHSTSTNSLTSSQKTDKPLPSSNLITNRNVLKTGTSDPRLHLVNGQSRKRRFPTPENTPHTPLTNSYLLPSPTSHQALYNNLQRAIRIQPPLSPPILVDYHDSYPQFQSTGSYNLLIELAIRHTQFGTAQWLFDAMTHAGIARDEYTRRLLVRWLTRTGRWEQAWTQATGLTPEKALDKPLRRGLPPLITKISCGVWMELLHTFQRSGLRRRRDIRRRMYEDRPDVLLPSLEIIKDPTPGTEASLRRQRLLACVQPIVKDEQWISPKVIKAFIYPIVRGGQTAEAVEIAKAYFSSLPVEISEEDVAQCLDIIHLLLSTDTRNGLLSHIANRRLLLSLLKAHASLKPSPKTLFLLLSPLKRIKKSGTVAFKILKAFEKSWGLKVIDVNVRQRVIRLAEKEGRKDIVQKILDGPTTTKSSRSGCTSGYHRAPTTFVSGAYRLPDKEPFAHANRESMDWRVYRQRNSNRQDDRDHDDSDALE